MQGHEPAITVIFVGARRPEAAIEQEMEVRRVKVQWVSSVKAAAVLFTSLPERTVVITELALADGNWRDLVERVKCLGRPIPTVLVASVRTAELWWDAMEFGVEDILVSPLSASQLCQFLRTHFTLPK